MERENEGPGLLTRLLPLCLAKRLHRWARDSYWNQAVRGERCSFWLWCLARLTNPPKTNGENLQEGW